MNSPACRCGLALRRAAYIRPIGLPRLRQTTVRTFIDKSLIHREPTATLERQKHLLDTWSQYREDLELPHEFNKDGRLVGVVGKRRNLGKHLSFADLTLPSGEVVQLCSKSEHDGDLHEAFRQLGAHCPVLVQAELAEPEAGQSRGTKPTYNLKHIRTLNDFPSDVIVTPETIFPPKNRNLQLQFHPELQARLRFRSWLKGALSEDLLAKGFTDIETPTLFKSTPEGAREFLVPTRQRGTAYALTQSPQQYKQVLVASGIGRYMQWARCYRDEDSRSDRQPEFSQLDMEWAYADAAIVQKDVEDVVLKALEKLQPSKSYQEFRNGDRIPVIPSQHEAESTEQTTPAHEFTRLTFADAISMYGTDKPDLRIPGRISKIPIPVTARHFVSMITHLPDPQVEAFAFSLKDCSPSESRKLVVDFMEDLPKKFRENPDGMPQILIYDSSQPSCGFSSIGFEYETILEAATQGQELQDGDLVVFQARTQQVGQYSSSSTKIGELRSLLWKWLVDLGQMDKPQLGEPGSLQFAWITEFPMFQPIAEDEPWKVSDTAAGITACHHPFTAPLSKRDLALLFTQPLEARSAAYDLVLNGTEVGGGSERNHIVDIQHFIMRDVLKMPRERLKDFSHLFEALRSGCPPHAGFALGFDRLVALMTDTSTVRDVIAFPKSMKGEDLFVQSPSKINNKRLEPYGLAIRNTYDGRRSASKNTNDGRRIASKKTDDDRGFASKFSSKYSYV